MRRILVLVTALATAAVVAALALAVPGNAAVPRLVATVGPGKTISLRTAAGAPVRSLRAGSYTVQVRDRSSEHNFRISGPGVNKATGVGAIGNATWRITLRRGKAYRFVCDPHSDDMRGSFRAR
jgi:plastocyanin